MMLRRHKQNRRGKAATASFVAAIRLDFVKRRLSKTFLDAAVVTTARTSCRMTLAELREERNSEPTQSVKLSICEEILLEMRPRLWNNLSWSDTDEERRMKYLGCMWSFEMGARVSDYESGTRDYDHCVRLDDLRFTIKIPGVTKAVSGSSLAALDIVDSAEGLRQIADCGVLGTSPKTKVPIKPKLIARRLTEESQFLEDVATYVMKSVATGRVELFCFRKQDGPTQKPNGMGRTEDDMRKQWSPACILQHPLSSQGSEHAHACHGGSRRG